MGEDRSIVTEIPGTTRDWIEAALSIGGIPLRLADTAGLRGEPEAPLPDPVEQIGVQRSRELLEQADLVLYLVDGSRGFQDEDEAFLAGPASRNTPFFLLRNKADIAPLPDPPPGGKAFLPRSAKTGQGLLELWAAVAGALEREADGEDGRPVSRNGAALGNRRQKELVDRAAAALEEALNLADRGELLELIAPSLREALDALGEISGEISSADILETIFSKFCVGK